MIKQIEKIVFPDKAEITDVSVSLTDMGERTITLTVKIDGDVAPDFSQDLKIRFNGEIYVHSARRPQATKDNNSRRATYNLTFQHEAIVELQRYYFIEMASTVAGTAIADKYDASLGLTLPNFITALEKVLNYYFGGKITASLNPSWSSSDIPSYVEINYSYIWDVLQKVYEIYAVRWTIERAGAEEDSKYIIKFGYDAEDATHIFEYGYKGGLLKVERQVQSTNIKNILLGRGGEKNLPMLNYFKGDDPDACPELANISFTELRSAEFRSYVQGWNSKHHSGLADKNDAYVDWAWQKGYDDIKFNPVEYVKDDKSIAEYGELWGALENNDAIYPSMEGLDDDIVAVDEITVDDDVIERPDVEQTTVSGFEIPLGTIKKSQSRTFHKTSNSFNVPNDKMGALIFGVMSLSGNSKEVKLSLGKGGIHIKVTLNDDNAALLEADFNLQIKKSYEVINPSSIPPGTYYIEASGTVNNTSNTDIENVKVKFESSSLVTGDGTNTSNPNVFHIWIKNIWDSKQNAGESDEEYTNRVWQPILGTESEEAAVVFRTGLLSISDYNFLIVKDGNESAVAHDETKEGSHWRLTLQKSDAEYAATGKLLPNSQINAKKGDRFYFTGIELPHKYVVAAEERLYNYKMSQLNIVKDIQPTWVVTIDKIRANKLEEIDEVKTLAEQLKVGAKIRLRDKRFMPAGKAAEYIEQYIQSVTYSWKEPSNNSLYLYPDIEVVLSDEVTGAQNPVETLSGKIDALERQIGYGGSGSGVNSNIQQILRALFNRIYLRKDMSDTTPYKLTSSTALEVGNFVPGSSGAIVYRDAETGQTIGELDKLYVRMKAYFETLEIVNANSIGGKQIISPAGAVRLALVVEPGKKYTENSTSEEGEPIDTEVTVPKDTYRCFFLAEQDGQEVENRYKKDDQVQSQDFNITKPGKYNKVTNHYYWRLVTGVTTGPVIVDGVGYHYVDLSATDADTRSDAPAVGDVIAHLGNRTDVDRQNALVFSSVDTFSPSITLYQGINNYSYEGKEMVSFGVDKTKNQAFMNVYGNMFVGKRDNSTYIKYTQENGVEIKGKLAVGSTLGNGKTIEETLKDIEQSAVNTANENIQAFKDAVTKDVENLQNQIDGAIETWFADEIPTPDNYPANEWETDDQKNIHLGDLYYSGEGKAYRFQMEGEDYVWKEIVDTDITKALEAAKKAQDTADGKRKIFVKQPTDADEYDVGDLWVNATYGDYSDDVLRAVTKKAAGAKFDIKHWTKASKYTDDTKAEQVQANVDQLSTTVNSLSGTVSNMKDFTDTAFADGIVDRSEKSAISNYINIITTTQKDVEKAYASVYNNALLEGVPKTNLKTGYDAFNAAAKELISAINTAIEDGKTTSTERANVDAKYTNFNTKYGDFVAYINAANKAIQDKINASAQDALTQIGGLAYLKKALKEDTHVSGGLIQSSVLALGYTLTDGVYKVMSGTNGIYQSSQKGGGIASWWGGAMKDRETFVSGSIPSDAAKAVIRMDGSGYLANGAIWWGTDGNLHADPQSFIIRENQLGDYLQLFQIKYRESTKTIDYMIPQYVMQHVEVADYLQIGDGRLKWDATNKAIYVEGKDGSVIGLYSKGWVSALGASPSTGGSGGGGGLIQSVYGYNDLGKTTFSNSNLNDTFNAYTINEINKRLTAVEKGGGIAPNDAVTLSTAQTITGQKTFNSQIKSTVPSGTAPFQCASTTLNTNLNADLLDGYHAIGGSNAIIKFGNTVCGDKPAWSRIATYSIPDTEVLADVCFILHSAFSDLFGILVIRARGGSYIQGLLTVSYNIDTSNIRIYHDAEKKNIELYCYGGNNYNIIQANLLYSHNRDGSYNNNITLYGSDEKKPSWSTYVNPVFKHLQNSSEAAKKLQTARTIWGQPFDGTANVSGYLTEVDAIELSYSTPYIDFHYQRSTADYTSRIIESQSGVLYINGVSFSQGSITQLKAITMSGDLKIGNGTSPNAIYFYGTTGDGPGEYTHTFIAERLWGGAERSELVLFKGNDLGDGNDAVNVSVSGTGPDRIRHIAAAHLFQTYTKSLAGSVESVCTSSALKNVFGIATNRVTSYVQLQSTVASGTAPFIVASNTVVGNLNADMVDGLHLSDFDGRYVKKAGDTMTGNLTMNDTKGFDIGWSTRVVKTYGVWIHGGSDGSSSTDANLRIGSWYGIGWYPTISGQIVAQGDNAMWLNVRNGWLHTAGAVQTVKFVSTVPSGTAPFQCASTTLNTNLNADLLDGYHATGGSNAIIKFGNTVCGDTPAWSRIATYSIPNTEVLTDVCFILHSAFSDLFGILVIKSRGGSYIQGLLTVSYNINTSNIRIYHDAEKKNIELYCYGGNNYSIIQANLLYSHNRDGSYNNNITLYGSDKKEPSWSTYVNPVFAPLQNSSEAAKKLQTARTIWGQPFDGTANVSGYLTEVDAIELSYSTPYIDFHYQRSTADYTSRIIESQSGVLYINGVSFSQGSITQLKAITMSGALSVSNTTDSSTSSTAASITTSGGLYVAKTIRAGLGIWSNGYVSALGQNTSSDMRLKNKLRDIAIPIAAIANAPSFLFSWKNKDTKDVGSSAQYWLNVLPDAVKQRDGYYEMGYGNIALVSCISLAKYTMKHETEIERLKRENKNMKKRIEELERRALS